MPRRPAGTTIALLACLWLGACTGDDSGGTDPARPDESPTSLAVEPAQPHVTGRHALAVLPGLAVVTDDECTPKERRRVCSSDGSQTWAPLDAAAPATLVEARTHLADRHTSWTAVLRFAPESRHSLRAATRQAAASGGVVLVMDGDRVLAAVPARTVHAGAVVLTGLDKPAAWDLVESFAGS